MIAGAVMLLCGAGIALIALTAGTSGGGAFSGVCGVIVGVAGLIVIVTTLRVRRRQ